MTNRLLFFMCLVFVFLYASFVLNPYWAENLWAYSMLVFAEVISIIYLIGMLWTSMNSTFPKLTDEGKKWKSKLFTNKFKTKLAVLIPTYKESPALLEETIQAVLQMKGTKFEVYLLDDAQNPQMKQLAAKYKIHYKIRNNHDFAKSGNLLNTLRQLSHIEYVVIFDSDFKPEPNFLIETLPFMADTEIAMVQTPQKYRNQNENFIARGSSTIQDFFYQFVMPGKNAFNAAFCVGTNMVFRKKALDQIGGYALRSHSEDIWTSRLLHEAGWKTLFLPMNLAYGLAPSTLEAFFNQQFRWCKGGTGMLFHNNTLFNTNLTLDQRLQYFFSNAYYLTGIAILIHMILPILYLVFGISAVRTDINTALWAARYFPYLVVMLGVFILTTKSRFFAAASVSIGVFPVYLRAITAALLNRDFKWKTTNASHSRFITELLFPHFIFLGASLAAFFIGVMTVGYYNAGTTVMALLWIMVNIFFLSSFIISSYGVSITFDLPFKRFLTKDAKLQLEKSI